MKCSKIRALISPYVDEMTDHKETVLVELHLAACSSCLEYAQKQRRLRQIMTRMDGPSAPAYFVEDFNRRLREEVERGRPGPGIVRFAKVLSGGKAWGGRVKGEVLRFYRWRKKTLE